jgi:PiT family inorganic phosphate transporter
MITPSILIVLLIGIALLFDFLNGFHDSSNVVATMISSRAVSPRAALLMSAVAHFSAPFLFGVAVAKTIGHQVVAEEAVTIPVILAAALSAIVWNVITWWLGIPSSSSHALIGGLVGAVAISFGLRHIQLTGLSKVLMALFISPLLGLTAGYVIMKLVLFLLRGASPRVSTLFKRLPQPRDERRPKDHGHHYHGAGCHWLPLALRGAVVGHPLERHGDCPGHSLWWLADHSDAGRQILQGQTHPRVHLPIHVVSSSIIGVGSAERLSKVRWGVAGNIVAAWVVTIPASALMAALLYHPALWLSAL